MSVLEYAETCGRGLVECCRSISIKLRGKLLMTFHDLNEVVVAHPEYGYTIMIVVAVVWAAMYVGRA